MRGRSKLPVFVENAAEFLTTGNKKFTNKSVVIISSVSGNTKEMVELVQIPLHRITDSASNGSVFPVVTEHFSASSDHAFL